MHPLARVQAGLDGQYASWRTAWRGLPDNPLAEYLRLSEGRRLARFPRWRRRIIPWLILLVALVPCGFVINEAVSNFRLGNPELLDLLDALALLVVWGLSVAFGISLLTILYDETVSIMGFMAKPQAWTNRLVLDDMSAVSSLTDHDIVAAVIRLYWPPLIRLALQGAVLFTLWLAGADRFFSELLLEDACGRVLLWSPLTIAAITVTGALAGLVYLHWLLAMGSGLGNMLFASLTGAAVVLAYIVYLPVAMGMALEGLRYRDGSFTDPLPVASVLAALLATLLLPLGLHLLLRLAGAGPAVRSFIAFSGPVFCLLGAVGIILTMIMLEQRGNPMHEYDVASSVLVAYMFGWSGTVILNPLAVPLPQCYGWPWGEWNTIMLEWYRLPLLLCQQVLMVMVAANATLRAVNQRRRNLI